MNRTEKTTRWMTILFTLVFILMFTRDGEAHIVAGESGGFLSGLKHPWSGWDHICAMVAVGLWGAQLGAPAIWILPVTFPVIMSMGGFLGLIDAPFPGGTHGDEIGIAASAILLGLMVLWKARPPLPVAMILVGFFGLCHGYAHGRELPPGQSGLLYSIGFVVATGTLHALGITIGLLNDIWKSRIWIPILATLLLAFMVGLGFSDALGVSGLDYWEHAAAGFVVAAAVLLVIVIKVQQGKMLIRALGAAITVGGLIFLYQAFTEAPEKPAATPTATAFISVQSQSAFAIDGI
ncbi:MAG: HupE/UreJ family protein [Tepidisphaeraceae bacterium]